MKKIWKYLLLIVLANGSGKLVCQAQITLDTIVQNTYSGIGSGFRAVQISPSETKWYFQDTTANTFSLYNMDFTPFMLSIAVPEPFQPTNFNNFNVLYITRALFDCDTSTIEYVYETPISAYYTFRIVRTDGTILFQLDSANGPYGYGGQMGGESEIRPIINTSVGAKLFLQRPNLLGGPEPIHVYSLCGTLPTEVHFSEINYSFIELFPNPVSNSLTFKINLPDNMNEYELVIVNNNAQEIKREKLNVPRTVYKLDVKNLSAGSYFYILCTKNKSYQSGKFIITK